jgi:phosphoribosylformimino-5-aminoimidazole carboxamide ribotide isomerase
MIVVPAIDVRAGRVVRLKQGRLQDEQVYGSDPAEAARRFEAEGASRLHLVDLDAALEGRPQPEVVEAVLRAVRIPVEVGGGLRTLEVAQRYRNKGAERLIFGTAVVTDPGMVQGALALFGEAVVVALDARNGLVTVGGWQETTQVRAVDLAVQVGSWGVRRVQYTDVVRDGMLLGPNLAGTAELAHVSGLRITAAGGISSLADLLRVRDCSPLVDEAVVGKALFEGRFNLSDARAMLGGD